MKSVKVGMISLGLIVCCGRANVQTANQLSTQTKRGTVKAPMRNAPMWPALEAVAHTLAYDVTIMSDYSLRTAQAASVAVPTLAIDGENSPPLLRRAVQAVAQTLPHAQRQTLKGQTHDVAPEALAPALEKFFAD
jgi:pimeloyl-ACP methyl ester carboxylesterase